MVTLDQVRYILGDWVDTILSLSHALYDMDIDLYAFACLCALTLVNGKKPKNTILSIIIKSFILV